MKKFIIKFSFISLFLVAFSFLNSCNKNEELGLNVQPSEDLLNVFFTKSIPITAHTVYEDSVRSDETTYNLAGSYLDPVFGLTTAGAYTQFRLTTTSVGYGTNAHCDSIVLSLAYQGFYGDTSSYLHLNVFEISDDFYYDNNYYSNDVLGVYKNNLADFNFKPNFKDSITVGSVKYAPHFRVKLKNSLGQKFIDASGTSDLADNTAFLKFFKGLYITTNNVSSGGAILYFNFLSSISKLTMYFHNDEDTLSYNFVINSDCARFNKFNHNKFSQANQDLKLQLKGDTAKGDSLLYIQAMAGTKIKLKFPEAINLNDLGKIAINKAELVLKVEDNSTDTYSPPEKLILSKINNDGTLSFIADYAYGDAYYGGSYSSTTKEYRFNVSKHIQDALLKGSFEDQGLFILVSGAAVKSNRVVIKGSKRSEDNLRLEIIYTKLE